MNEVLYIDVENPKRKFVIHQWKEKYENRLWYFVQVISSIENHILFEDLPDDCDPFE